MSRIFKVENHQKLPDNPGVYFFLDKEGEVLYVGKATSLRDRVKSYFKKDVLESRGPLIEGMMEKAKKIKIEETDSVLEALILEAKMIKKWQPPHNTKDKSDKSFYYCIITKEKYPRVLLMRERELLMEKINPKDVKYRFGPFPSSSQLREALRLIRKIFPYRDKCEPEKGKPCFNAQIGLCPGVCASWVSQREYGRRIQHLRLFFEGRKKALMKSLEREMKQAAKKEDFEHAEALKKQMFALNHIQDVSLIKRENHEMSDDAFRMESYDIAHTSGKYVVGVMTVIENGDAKKSDYRKFRIKSFRGADDTRALREVLERRLGHLEWPLPQVFVIDGGKAQRDAARDVLEYFQIKTPVVSVVKDERHRPREILGNQKLAQKYHDQILLANSEAHRFAIQYHRTLRGKI